MSIISNTSNENYKNLYEIFSLLIFILSVALGICFPVIAIPWMVALLLFGFVKRKAEKGTFLWYQSRAALEASIALAFIIIMVMLFLWVW